MYGISNLIDLVKTVFLSDHNIGALLDRCPSQLQKRKESQDVPHVHNFLRKVCRRGRLPFDHGCPFSVAQRHPRFETLFFGRSKLGQDRTQATPKRKVPLELHQSLPLRHPSCLPLPKRVNRPWMQSQLTRSRKTRSPLASMLFNGLLSTVACSRRLLARPWRLGRVAMAVLQTRIESRGPRSSRQDH